MGCVGSKNSELLRNAEVNPQLVASISNSNATDRNYSATGDSIQSDGDTGNNYSVTGAVSTETDKENTKEQSDHNHPADTMMMRKGKSKSDSPSTVEQEKTSARSETLEENIQHLTSISEEDANKALAMIKKHPNHRDDFSMLVSMKDLVGQDPKKFLKHIDKPSFITPLMDFWAFIGGAKVTVEAYVNQLKKLGVTHVTDKLLDDYSGESVEGLDIWKLAMPVVSELRKFWVNSSDASTHFGACLAEAQLFPYLAEDIKHLDKNFKSGSDTFEDSVTILHNCAKNKELRQYFRDIGLVQLLTPYLSKKEKDIKLLCLLTISYIIDEEDNQLLTAHSSDFDFLLDMISLAWADDDHCSYDGYHLEELLQGVGNLAQNDENKKLLMEKGALIHLKPILEEGKDVEKQEAAKVVWELAFDKENRHLMETDVELMKILHDLQNSSHHGVAKASSGALWVLNMDNTVRKHSPKGGKSQALQTQLPPPPEEIEVPCGGLHPLPPPPSATPASPPPAPSLPAAKGQGHIMISYNWGNQKMLMKIRDNLRAQGFSIWMDVDNISGSTLQAMAEAVEGASVVLMCMSQRYKDSPNCRTEAEYAFSLQKPIIPLLMERNYKPDGWLGILRGSKLFFDFSGKYPYETKLNELVKELGQKGRSYSVSNMVDASVVAERALPVASAVTAAKSVKSWSNKDIHDWINKNHLQGCPKLQSLSGENIKFLQKLSQRAPEFYFTYLKQDLGLITLNDLMHFSDAVDNLP